jgi:hypothetical protein
MSIGVCTATGLLLIERGTYRARSRLLTVANGLHLAFLTVEFVKLRCISGHRASFGGKGCTTKSTAWSDALITKAADPKLIVNTPTIIGPTGGSLRHSLVLEHALRPLFAYLRAAVVPTAVFASAVDWATDDASDVLHVRVRRAGRSLHKQFGSAAFRCSSRTWKGSATRLDHDA